LKLQQFTPQPPRLTLSQVFHHCSELEVSGKERMGPQVFCRDGTSHNTSYTVCRATAWVQALTLWLDFEPILYKSADVNGLLTKCRSCMGLIQQQMFWRFAIA